jgi:hypothetical protein
MLHKGPDGCMSVSPPLVSHSSSTLGFPALPSERAIGHYACLTLPLCGHSCLSCCQGKRLVPPREIPPWKSSPVDVVSKILWRRAPPPPPPGPGGGGPGGGGGRAMKISRTFWSACITGGVMGRCFDTRGAPNLCRYGNRDPFIGEVTVKREPSQGGGGALMHW